jgi:2-amino-4-hydroxy-6-hydroxymethyldihydropteridine pyrophosphokinase
VAEMGQVFIGLGSNLGDRAYYLHQALVEIANSPQIIMKKYSSVYETEPVGKKEQPQFLNMVAELESTLLPRDLLQRLKEIENALGRTHTEHWGPREIDLDILYYGSEVFNDEKLRLPHPEIVNRRFVLVPMKEIAGEFLDPMQHLSMKELLRRCSDTSIVHKVPLPMDLQVKV